MEMDPILIQEVTPEVTLKEYFYNILKRRNIVITVFLAATIISAIQNLTKKPTYAACTKILIQDPAKPMSDKIEVESLLKDMSGGLYIRTQIEVMKSVTMASSILEGTDLMSKYSAILGTNPKSAARKIRSMININQIGDTRVFGIIVRSPDPRFSLDAVNALVDAYIEKNIITSFLVSEEAMSKWFPKDGRRVRLEDIYGKLKEFSRDEIIQSLPSVMSNPKIIELKAKKRKIENEISLYTKKYTDRHPKLISAKSELKAVNDEIRSTADGIVDEIKDAMSGKFRLSNIKVIEPAELPQAPVEQKRLKNFLLVAIMAFFSGCGLALLIDYLDNTVKTQEDVERKVRLPYLGYVPLIKKRSSPDKDIREYIIVDPSEQKSSLMEALRNIRTNIIFSAPPDSLKSILVASALPKEGKSTISINMALAFSVDGARTLLVDGDMRRPNLHKMMGVKNSTGLSNYLTSRMLLKDVLQETRFQNLKFVSCGPIPPNPAELFGSYRMKEFLAEAREIFDRIIFDGPPLFGLSDSVVLGKAVDGVIQVIRFGKITWDMATRSKQRLQNIGVKITGVVINGVEVRKESYYYKYYDYSYHKYYE